MAADLNRDELEGLVGAYALDAVDADEARQVERYLEDNAAAREEAGDFKEIASWLVTPTEEPPDLWAAIQRSLDPRPAASSVSRLEVARGNRSPRRLLAAAAALVIVATLAAALLSGGSTTTSDRARIVAAALAAQGRPGVREARLDSADGTRHVRVVYLPDGRGYLLGSNLPTLSRDRTYQLWAVVGRGTTQELMSAGVLGRRVDVAAFQLAGRVDAFAITAEATPGAHQPSTSPEVFGRLE